MGKFLQLRDLEGNLLCEKPVIDTEYSSVGPTLKAIHDEVGDFPADSAIVAINSGRAVYVQSAPRMMEPFPRGDAMEYALSMADYVYEKRKDPEHQLIPPRLHFQQLDFGADSDAANIAAACLIDRILGEIFDDKIEDGETHFFNALYELAEVHGELWDTNIREDICAAFDERYKMFKKV